MKKFAQLFLISTVAAALALAGTGCSAKAKKAYHLARADKFFTATNWPSAEIEYLNALRYDAQNERAYARLGSIYYDEGRLQRAVFFLGRASALATNDVDLRLKLGFIYSAAARFKEARDEALFALDRQPQNDEAALLLAESSVDVTNIASAKARLQSLAKNGDRAGLEVALGNLFFRERDVDQAAAAFKRARKLDPSSPAVNAGLGALAWAQNDLPQADADFKAAAAASPFRSPRRTEYARFKIQTGDLPGAEIILSEVLKNAPDYIPAMMLLAQIAAVEKHFDQSAKLLNEILSDDPDNFDAMFFIGGLKAEQGNLADAVTDFERMTRLYPQIAQVHFQLARLYFALGDNIKAINSLNRTLELQPEYVDALLLRAQVDIKNNNANAVIVAMEGLVKKQPQLAEAQLLLADAYRLQNRIDGAMAIYRRMEKDFPENVQIPLLIGSADLQLKDDAGARSAFNRALEISPTNLPALEQLVDLDIEQKQPDAAMQRVGEELKKRPRQIELHLLTAKIYLAAGNPTQAETTLLQAIQIQPDDQASYLLLAQLYYSGGQNQKAVAQLEAALAHGPDNISALMLLASIHSADKDYQKAADAYEKILVVNPQFSPAMNNLAYLYSQYLNRLDRAYDLAQSARKLLPFDPSTADTLGWICWQRGNYSTALGLLQEAAAKMPEEAEVNYHLGMADYMMDDEASARAVLQHSLQLKSNFAGHAEAVQALAILDINANADASTIATLEKRVMEKSDDPIALSRLAAIYERMGNPEKAIADDEKILQSNSKNLEVLTNLARLYSAITNIPSAYDKAKSAYKLAPYNPDVSHILGKLAYQSGDYKISASLLQESVKNQPANATLWFDLAQSQFSLGNISDARNALQQALQLNLPSPAAVEARQILDLTALAQNPAQAAANQSRVEDILKTRPDYVPALLVRAVAAQQENQPAAAADAYEKILSRFPDFIVAQKQLAILYAKDSTKTDRAYDLAVKARTTLPNDPELEKTMGILLLQKGDLKRAIGLFTQSATFSSADSEIFYYLGKAQVQNKNLIPGKENLQRALTLKLSEPLAASAKQMLGEMK